MVQIIDRPKTISEKFGEGLGQGIAGGVNFAADFASKMLQKKYEMAQRENLIRRIRGEPTAQENSSPSLSPQTGIPSVQTDEEAATYFGEPSKKPNFAEEFTKSQSSQNKSLRKDPYREAEEFALANEPELSRVAMERAKSSQTAEKEYVKHAAKENSEFLTGVGQLENDMPNTQFALGMIEDALGNADKWAAAKDLLAEKTGFAGFRSASGAELDSAIKNYFLGDLSSIKGGRANVFIEKQIRDAYMKAGQDPISNQKILLGMRMKEAINRVKIQATREMEDHFLKKEGFLPPNFKSTVNKLITPKVNEIEKNAINSLHHMSKIESERDKIFNSYLKKGETLMIDAEGNPFAVPNKEVAQYREQGYIPLGKK